MRVKYRIKELRKERNMTCEELAGKSGICRTTLYWLENNIKEVTTSRTLLSIADALGVTVNDLFLNDGVQQD